MALATDGLSNAKAYKYIYADATARLAATGFVAADVGALALQVDTAALYLLTDESPITWVPISSGLANPMTTNGDIIVGGSSGTPTRVAKGANNTVWGVDGGGNLGYKADPAGGGGGGLLTLLTSDTAPTGGKQYLTLTVPSSAPGDLLIIGTFVSEKATAGNDTLLLDNGSGTALMAASGITTGTLGGVPSMSALTLSSPAALEMTIFNAEPIVAFPAVINTLAAKYTLNGIGQGAAWISHDFKGNIVGPIVTLRFKTGGGAEWAVGSTVSLYRRG